MSGSLVSTGKLATSFWEHYRVQTLEKSDCDKQSPHAQAQHPHLMPSFKRTRCPSSSAYCKLFDGLEETSEITKEACKSNMASNQTAILANVFHRMRLLEERQSRNLAGQQKLRLVVEDVASRVQELELSQKSALIEVNSSLQNFGEQLAISRRREQEKVKLAFLHLHQEMEEYRNTCRLLKIQNKKLAKDLTNANITAADACKELERERKARELLEEVCNELAREIGEDKAEVEQLKQEQEKSRERLDEELKMMRMVALWQDEGVNEDVSEAKNEEHCSMALLVNGAACSNSCCGTQETISSMTGIMLNRDAGNGSLNGEEQRGSIKSGRPRKLRRPTRTGGRQRHKGGIIDWMSPNYWENRGTSAWASSEDELFQKQPTTCQNRMSQVGSKDANNHDQHVHVNSDVVCSNDLLLGGGQSELAKSSDGVRTKVSTHSKQCLHVEVRQGSHKKHSASTHFENGGHVEADMASGLLCSFSEDNVTSCTGRGSELKRIEESASHEHDRHAGQERRSSSGVQDEYNHLNHVNDNLDMHRSIGGSAIGSADSELDHICLEPVKGACKDSGHDKLSHEVTGDQGSRVNTARVARGISDCSNEPSCGIMAKCTQGCTDAKKVDENSGNSVFPTNPELNKFSVESRAGSGDHEAMKKMSPWRPASAKSLVRLWPSSPDAFSVFGGAMKRSFKACSLSPPSVKDEQRLTNISSLHTRSHTMEGSMAAEDANQQPLACISDNSLGAQLIKARELEENVKPAKPSFRSTPRRRAVSYG